MNGECLFLKCSYSVRPFTKQCRISTLTLCQTTNFTLFKDFADDNLALMKRGGGKGGREREREKKRERERERLLQMSRKYCEEKGEIVR